MNDIRLLGLDKLYCKKNKNRLSIKKKMEELDKKYPPLPKLSERCKKMSKSTLENMLCLISDRIIREVYSKYKDCRKDMNIVNEEANDYDEIFFKDTGFDRCLLESGQSKKCYCAKCIMNEDLSLDMISTKCNYLKTLKGKKIFPVCYRKYDPVIVKRGKRYYLLVKSEVKNFNIFLPIVDVLNTF